jgi:outer membrane protein
MKQWFSTFTLLVLLGTSVIKADIVGGEVSLGIYAHTPSGNASYHIPFIGKDTTLANVEETFGWGSEQDLLFQASFEHPAPLIPNIKLGYSRLSYEGSGSSVGFTWGNIVGFTGSIESSFDLGMADFTAYYELLDNVFDVDLGVTLRYLSGDVTVTPYASALSEEVSFSVLTPMLYGKLRFNLPVTDLSFQAEGNGIGYGDTTFYDLSMGVRYELFGVLGIEGGWRSVNLESSDLADGLFLDLQSNGVYALIVWDF